MRRHDVSVLVRDRGWDQAAFDLCPWPSTDFDEYRQTEPERTGATSESALARLLRSCFDETVGVERGPASLVVTATPEQHDQVEQLLTEGARFEMGPDGLQRRRHVGKGVPVVCVRCRFAVPMHSALFEVDDQGFLYVHGPTGRLEGVTKRQVELAQSDVHADPRVCRA